MSRKAWSVGRGMADMDDLIDSKEDEPPGTLAGDPSADLIRRAREGDRATLELLMRRHLPSVSRWARGRLPAWARDSMNTDDIVQDVFLRSMANLSAFEPRHSGAMTAYLRQAVLHRIRDEIRKTQRKPGREEIPHNQPAGTPSPHEEAEAMELLESYEAALGRLREEDRQAIVARVELKLPYREVAAMLGKPTEEAAQMAVSRALVRLAREMGRSS